LVEGATLVKLEDHEYPVHRAAKRGLGQVDFDFEGEKLHGLEQNLDTQSRWAEFAHSGKRVMQFIVGGRYTSVVMDIIVTFYGASRSARGAASPLD
jgi:hypothetical protein